MCQSWGNSVWAGQQHRHLGLLWTSEAFMHDMLNTSEVCVCVGNILLFPLLCKRLLRCLICPVVKYNRQKCFVSLSSGGQTGRGIRCKLLPESLVSVTASLSSRWTLVMWPAPRAQRFTWISSRLCFSSGAVSKKNNWTNDYSERSHVGTHWKSSRPSEGIHTHLQPFRAATTSTASRQDWVCLIRRFRSLTCDLLTANTLKESQNNFFFC